MRKLPVLALKELRDRNVLSGPILSTAMLDRFKDELEEFKLPGTEMLSMMKFTDCLASGSFVVNILFPGRFIPGDLDLYTSSVFQQSVILFLRNHGYTHTKSVYTKHVKGSQYLNGLHTIDTIFELRHNVNQKKVNVIVSTGRAILPILQFHSTLVMNYISHHGIVITNGALTMQGIGISNILPEKITPQVKQCFDKYINRGFNIWQYNRQKHECAASGGCAQTTRCLFDDHIEHFVFPSQTHGSKTTLRLNEAKIAKWRAPSGPCCLTINDDRHGFVICDEFYLCTSFSPYARRRD